MTEAEKQELAKIRRESRKARGICVQCGMEKASKNQNGTPSVKGDRCRAQDALHNRRKSDGDIMSDRDFESERGYLDSAEFAAYCVETLNAFPKLKAYTLGDVRRKMGKQFNERRAMDAIEALIGAGEIERVGGQFGYRDRWQRRRPVKPVWRKNPTVGLPADRTVPMSSSYDFQKSVTA